MTTRAQRRGKIIIGIPTVSRAPILADTVRAISRQTRLPDRVILSIADPADTGGVENETLPFPVELLIGPKGLTRQRNRVMQAVSPDDILLFLDDDFLMAPDYLEQMERVFAENEDIVLTTGMVMADGIIGPGYDHATGERLLRQGLRLPAETALRPTNTGYGCNFALRMRPVLEAGLTFDERLPLYGWLEDVDFSTRVQGVGRLVKAGTLRGVHLGTKTGRSPGLKLGYSQIANPVYMMRKRTIATPRALDLMLRNIASNLRGTVLPRAHADHRGRLMGNLRALGDLLRGLDDPQRVLALGAPPPSALRPDESGRCDERSAVDLQQ